MADDSPRALVCLIEGESTPFRVEIAGNKDIMDLKKLIKEEEQISAPARNLTLWKTTENIPVIPSVTLPERVGNPVQGQRVAMLDSGFKIAAVWPEQPNDEHVHIIVALRSATVPIQPPLRILEIEEIDPLVKKELKSLRDVVAAFLKSPDPPLWAPPDYAAPSDREFLANLQIPSYADGRPSLLFHDLHSRDDDEIKKIFGTNDHVWVCNTSGSGKTRRILECLTVYWGFYFTVLPDRRGVGAGDLEYALAEVASDPRWTEDLRLLHDAGERVGKSHANSLIASRPLKKVLAARIVVFELFLKLAKDLDGELEERHKRTWLFFQLSNPQANPSDSHPFVHIMKSCLHQASTHALNKLIDHFGALRQEHMPRTHFIAGVDEAQVAVRLSRHSFVSSSSDQVYRTILREIAKTFSIEPIKLVVSGTGITLEDLRDSVASGVSKPATVILHHNLGMFDTWSKLQSFLERYIPSSFLETIPGGVLKQRIREYLLGRYRFVVSFLEYFLMNGLKSPHRLLSEYIKGHINCYPESGNCLDTDEPELHVQVCMSVFEWDRLLHDQDGLRKASEILQSHLTRGKTPTFGPVSLKFVEYGLARLREDLGGHHGQIIEPLAFLSLMRWLQYPPISDTQPANSLITNIQSRLAYPPSRGYALEEVVILYLLRTLRIPVPFNTVFKFHGTPPSWADNMAQISGHLEGKPVPVSILEGKPQNPGLCAVQYGDTIQDILNWVNNWNNAVAVLVPCTSFGPDIMVWCGKVLLMGQVKSYLKGNADNTLGAEPMSKALESLQEDHWFENKTNPQELELLHKLKDAIKQNDVLRFVAGSPLAFKLNSRAPSVRRALQKLGPNVVLASININADSLRSTFIEEDLLPLLEPIEAAQDSKKRKSDAMNV